MCNVVHAWMHSGYATCFCLLKRSVNSAASRCSCTDTVPPWQEADEEMNFDELILDSCQAIAAATSALVKAASSAQRELVEKGLVSFQDWQI